MMAAEPENSRERSLAGDSASSAIGVRRGLAGPSRSAEMTDAPYAVGRDRLTMPGVPRHRKGQPLWHKTAFG
jgi:hypothetical protein